MSITQNRTLTCLQKFADWAMIDPLYFNGLDISGCGVTDNSLCQDHWFQYPTRSNYLSRETLAHTIRDAEYKVQAVLGTFVKSNWTYEEIEIMQHYDKKNVGYIDIKHMKFQTNNSIVKQFGQRLSTLVAISTLNYLDRDNDGFNEVSQFTVTLDSSVNLCDVKIYFTGHNGEPDYEICPVRLVSYSSGVAPDTYDALYEIDSWLLVDPSNYLYQRWGDLKALSACADIYVEDIEVRIESADPCLPQVEIIYQDNTCTIDCEEKTLPACAIIQNNCEGIFSIIPQTIDNDTGCVSPGDHCLPNCFRPIKLRIWYQAGCYQTNCGVGKADDCDRLNSIVFKLASSMLPFTECDCPCVEGVIRKWQEETSLKLANEGKTWFYPTKVRMNSPWGTTLGALEAWLELVSYIDSNMC